MWNFTYHLHTESKNKKILTRIMWYEGAKVEVQHKPPPIDT